MQLLGTRPQLILIGKKRCQQPIAGVDERHGWDFRFPRLGTMRKRKERRAASPEECAGQRRRAVM